MRSRERKYHGFTIFFSTNLLYYSDFELPMKGSHSLGSFLEVEYSIRSTKGDSRTYLTFKGPSF